MKTQLDSDHVIVMERTTFDALEETYPDWICSIIDLKSAIEVMPKWALLLVCTKSGHRIMITASYFIAFAESTNMASRFKSIEAHILV